MANSEQVFLDLLASDLIDVFGKEHVKRHADDVTLEGKIDLLSDKGFLPCVTDGLVKNAIKRYAGNVNYGRETESESGYKQFFMGLSSLQQAELETIIAGIYESGFKLDIMANDKAGSIQFKVDFTLTDPHGEKTSKEWPSHKDTQNLDPEQLASWFRDNFQDPETFCL